MPIDHGRSYLFNFGIRGWDVRLEVVICKPEVVFRDPFSAEGDIEDSADEEEREKDDREKTASTRFAWRGCPWKEGL